MSITSARVLSGRYQLHTMLGRGGMATVWAGQDTRLDRPVAVKIVDVGAPADVLRVQRLDQEARTVARLAHPNIVAIYDVATDQGLPYLVMEMVEGADLQQRLALGPMAVRDAVRIAAEICSALEAAHEAGLVHRDIKPANILLTRTGTVKVCDFGIAALQQPAMADPTGHTVAIGTSEYMAPEQAVGARVDARADIYAVGCVLYAMLTGAPPFAGSPEQVLLRQVHEPPAPVAAGRPDIHIDLATLVGELLAKNPDDRPARARDVRARLLRLPGGVDPVVSATVETPVGTRPPARATAPVVTPTRTMAAFGTGADHSAHRARMRLGPAGIAGVAIAAAAITGVVVAVLMAGQSAQPVVGAAVDPTGTGSPATSSAVVDPAMASSTLRDTIQAQVSAGQLDSRAAGDLVDGLDDVDRRLAKGDTKRAAEDVAKLREDLADVRADDRITDAGFLAITQSLDQLARLLPSDSDG